MPASGSPKDVDSQIDFKWDVERISLDDIVIYPRSSSETSSNIK